MTLPADHETAAEPTDRRDIVDEIDQLVDEQMRRERSGWDHSINQARCPHPWCGEPWHGLAITTRMREMRQKWRAAIEYDEEDDDGVPADVAAELDAYRYDQDDSQILCPGSNFTGEFVPPQIPEAAKPPAGPPAGHAWLRVVPLVASVRDGFQLLGSVIATTVHRGDRYERGWRPVCVTRGADEPSPQWWRCDDVTGSLAGALSNYCGQGEIGSTNGRIWAEIHATKPPPHGDWYLRDETAILDLDQLHTLLRLAAHGQINVNTAGGMSLAAIDSLLTHAFTEILKGSPSLSGAWINPRNLRARETGITDEIVNVQVLWQLPESRTAEFRGGLAHNRPVISLEGPIDVIAIPAPITLSLADNDLAFQTVHYRRAGFNTITGNWVYRPETEMSRPTEARTNDRRQ